MGQIVNRRRVFGGGIDNSMQYQHLTFVSLADNNEIKFFTNDDNNTRTILVYSDSDPNVVPVTSSSVGTTMATLNSGDRLYANVSVDINSFSDGTYYHYFEATGDFALEGNIMSLLYSSNFFEQTALPKSTHTFYRMFYNCAGLVDISNLVMPATTLATYCYYGMFQDCTGLTSVPSNLLPATTLADYCYHRMFCDCTSLTAAPELPATTLEMSCYGVMFYNCTSLTTAPELPATTLANLCYRYMFYNCSRLNYIKAMFTTRPSEMYTPNWVYNVASSGTFVKNSRARWNVTGVNGIPSGWTVQTA